jgi:RNA 3'-terminal phosphate cyclase (ATP)
MISIDGSAGEGGGQVLRTSLALSAITGQPFRIERIRAGRRKPGLMRQHLTAVLAMAEVCSGTAVGAEAGSATLEFTPGKVRGGDYRFSIGTAGSTSLVLQTVLLPLLTAKEPSRVILEGGTHNPHAPSFEFLDRAFLPLLARMGAEIQAKLVRPGFYPAGGGCVEVTVQPQAVLMPLHLRDRGELRRGHAEALVVNLPASIGERELAAVASRLKWSPEQMKLLSDQRAPGPGNVLTIYLEFADMTQIVVGFGEQGVSAESVATRQAKVAARLLASSVTVDPCLSDQLLMPMALAGGGSFTALSMTTHARTNIDVIRQFLPIPILVDEAKPELCFVSMGS